MGEKELATWKRFLAGTASGAALVLVGHPLDTLKVQMQVTNKSMLACARDLVKDRGVIGLYRGMSIPLVTTGFVNTVLWGVQFTAVHEIAKGAGRPPAPEDAMVAALFSGAFISVLVTPMEGIKSRLQAQPGTWQSGKASPLSVGRDVYAKLGVRGLYRGLAAVVFARASNWAYFGSYTAVSRQLEQRFGQSKQRNALVAGGIAGICYWLAAFPFDVVKGRMMAAPDVTPPVYNGFLDAASKLYREQGLRGFSRGFLPCALRAFPANAAAFFGFETALKALETV